jgi:hypothetical protein
VDRRRRGRRAAAALAVASRPCACGA